MMRHVWSHTIGCKLKMLNGPFERVLFGLQVAADRAGPIATTFYSPLRRKDGAGSGV